MGCMSVLQIITAPNDFLKQKSLPITAVDDKIKALASDMLETMYAERGIGLSAVQVGYHLRLIVIDVEHSRKKDGTIYNQKQYIMINPVITSHSNEINVFEEGCLSFPEQHITIKRPKIINVDYTDINNNPESLTADGIFATCIQHEIDHLNGITITNYVSHFKEELILKRLKKMRDRGDI